MNASARSTAESCTAASGTRSNAPSTNGVNDWPERSSPYVVLWKPPSAACCAQRYCAARVSEPRSRVHEHAAADADVNKKTRRSTRTIDREVQNRRTCHRYPSSDAVVTGPCAIAVLQAENFLRDVRMPFRPGVAADALHAVADVQIGEELLAAHRPVSTDEGCIRELTLNRADLLGVLHSVGRGAAQLLQRLRTLIERDACGFGGRGGRGHDRSASGHPTGRGHGRRWGAEGAHRVALGALQDSGIHRDAFALSLEEAARGHRRAEHRRPAASDVPASVRLLMLLDLRDGLLQRFADPSVQRRRRRASVNLRHQHRGQKRVDARAQLSLDLRALAIGDCESIGWTRLDSLQDKCECALHLRLVLPAGLQEGKG